MTLPAIFLTPHEAGLTELNIQGTTAHIVDVIARLESGEPVVSQLNKLEDPGKSEAMKARAGKERD